MTTESEEHYIEVKVWIGPISPPYVLHTFRGNRDPVDTVHGMLVGRLFDAIYDIVPEAVCSAHVQPLSAFAGE